MSLGAAEQKNTQAEVIEHVVRAVGGSSAITKEIGPGVAVSRTGAGAYRLTWSENPGVYMGAVASLQAATPGDLAGHTVIFDTYDSTNFILDLVVYNNPDTGTGGQPAAHDLAASEYFCVVAKFARTSVTGA